MTIENPGSLVEYAGRNGLSVDAARNEYARVLDNFRLKLAENMGITLEDLHDYNFVRTETEVSEKLQSGTTRVQVPELI